LRNLCKTTDVFTKVASDVQFAESFLREQWWRYRWLAKKRSKLHIRCGRHGGYY